MFTHYKQLEPWTKYYIEQWFSDIGLPAEQDRDS